VAGLIHLFLRTLMLPGEVKKKQSAHIDLKIGRSIPNKKIAGISRDSDHA
jgi:hypothetical protein